MKIRPIKNNVVVEPQKEEGGRTETGIYLPETAEKNEKPQIGKVIAVGDGDKIKVKVGESVIYNKYSGTDVELDGKEYLILKSDDILAVIE